MGNVNGKVGNWNWEMEMEGGEMGVRIRKFELGNETMQMRNASSNCKWEMNEMGNVAQMLDYVGN